MSRSEKEISMKIVKLFWLRILQSVAYQFGAERRQENTTHIFLIPVLCSCNMRQSELVQVCRCVCAMQSDEIWSC